MLTIYGKAHTTSSALFGATDHPLTPRPGVTGAIIQGEPPMITIEDFVDAICFLSWLLALLALSTILVMP